MPTALSAADAQDSEQISACRLCGQLCCPVAEREQRFEDTSFGVALNALHRQGVVEERAQRFACRRTIDPKGWRIPLRTLTPMLAPPHSESHIQLIEQSKTRAATKVKHAATNSEHGEFFEFMLCDRRIEGISRKTRRGTPRERCWR